MTRLTTRKPAQPKFTTRLFYGRVSVTHYDADRTVEIANIISRALIDAGERAPIRINCEWIYHEDGTESVESRWNGKKWIKEGAVK